MERGDRVLDDISGGQGVVRIHVEALAEQPTKIRSLHEVRKEQTAVHRHRHRHGHGH